jgi:uroporphyrin-III C-methyltransferase
VEIYRQRNLHNLPIALIQMVHCPMKRLYCTIDNILDESTEKRVGVPAIIVIGEVVAKHRSFQHIKEKALAL